MDYFNEAFGGFNPESDRDAALKFSLCVLVLDSRMQELLQLIEGGNDIGGVEGDPGWIIERRDEGGGYEGWSNGAEFRAFVDPNEYSLSHPEFFVDRRTFIQYVVALMKVYRRRHHDETDVIRRIAELIGIS
ncbi:hypothetical protein [Burkholderia stabilis]|uniref:hypothetical protein n=1 Tax=Burkholderia stabilis TaxID=95485 RepID=UPI0012E9B2F4|nr:hypothetical protein [Burkholderia stabilis]HDR9491700.1 hypothetical protein [Burkholderia stabilis]HDR9522321.1 hypothetical protein [Burkholderia stabilis]HDR9529570.1 hypothetical protein [Burkholderia stabilis]HDR9539151.1 hypothetical protein [Burkholderia stabilis]HDR9547266.1 hypothetical protein [Burkholderia stabilis]